MRRVRVHSAFSSRSPARSYTIGLNHAGKLWHTALECQNSGRLRSSGEVRIRHA